MSADSLILSCEHATAHVPRRYRELFASPEAKKILKTHRGSDIGALWLARGFERAYGCPLFEASVTRLLVDANRSVGHPSLHSKFTSGLEPIAVQGLVDTYYLPYRKQVLGAVDAAVRRGRRVIHLSVHSFTPRLGGEERRADVGFLYDPRRAAESRWVLEWRAGLLQSISSLRVRRNYPYRGVADGMTRWLRTLYDGRCYLGIELEVNQRFFSEPAASERGRLLGALVASLPFAAVGSARRRPPRSGVRR